MTKTEAVIRSILGTAKPDIRPLAYAVDAAISLIFVQKIPMDDIYVTEDIYPDVAKLVKTGVESHPLLKRSPGESSAWPISAGTPWSPETSSWNTWALRLKAFALQEISFSISPSTSI